MREIKFRAWDVEAKRLYQPRCIEYTPGGGNWLLGENTYKTSGEFEARKDGPELNADNPESAVLMQYAGLKDKKGVEIYEGDIIRIKYHPSYNKLPDDTDSLAMVKYAHDRFFAASTADTKDYLCFYALNTSPLFRWGESEVIGNIYENPELLSPTNTKEDK